MNNDINRIDYKGLDLYTKRFKEWIFKLFRRAEARMGHIEEEIAKVRAGSKFDYQLTEDPNADPSKISYVLKETTTGENHGSITISKSGSVDTTVWEEDLRD